MTEKTLYILRHAKTEPHGAERQDHERELTQRGIGEAQNLGKYLKAEQVKFQRIWCSTATRTRQTLEHLQANYGQLPKVEYANSLYHMSMEDMFRFLPAIEEKTQSLLWVGHNPGLHEFCVKMAAASGESELTRRVHNIFPPCSFCEFTLHGKWEAIGKCEVSFKRFIIPGDI